MIGPFWKPEQSEGEGIVMETEGERAILVTSRKTVLVEGVILETGGEKAI